MRKRRNGFTLIELAIATLVGGLILAGGMTVYNSWLSQQYMLVTQARMTDINTAINNYAMHNGHLPCVASYTLASSSSLYGMELVGDCATGTASSGTFRVASAYPALSPGFVHIGAVPFRALGLPEEDRADYLNNQFTYAVTESEATATINNNNGAISVTDGTNNVVNPIGSPTSSAALYVLIAHGKDGNGAYPRSATATVLCPAGTELDATNCKATTATFIAAPYSEASGAAHFDDYITVVNYMALNCYSEVTGQLFDGVTCVHATNTIYGGYMTYEDGTCILGNSVIGSPPFPTTPQKCGCPTGTVPMQANDMPNPNCGAALGGGPIFYQDGGQTTNCGTLTYVCLYPCVGGNTSGCVPPAP